MGIRLKDAVVIGLKKFPYKWQEFYVCSEWWKGNHSKNKTKIKKWLCSLADKN